MNRLILGSSHAGTPAPGGEKSSALVSVTERDFEAEVLRSELPVMLYFTAAWCKPCKQIGPEVEALAKEMEGQAKIVKVDIDQAPIVAKQLRVQSVPTFMIVAEGRIVDAAVGAAGKKKLRQMLEPFLPRAEGALKPIELAELLRQGMVVPVDTRDAAAFGRARIPTATNLPLDEIRSRLAELHMLAGRPVLYCRSGEKSKELAALLAEDGLPVAFLEGGFLGWEAEGLPVQK